MDNLSEKKVVIGLDGTMESSVVAFLLKKQGYQCIGVHVSYLVTDSEKKAFDSWSQVGLEQIREICEIMEIPFYAVKAGSEFHYHVLDRMVASKVFGLNFAPLVARNKMLFDILCEKANLLGAKYVATGHMAKVLSNTKTNQYFLGIPNDYKNDDSYQLSHISMKHLSRLIFPLAEMKINEVDKVASLINYQFEHCSRDYKELRAKTYNSKAFKKLVEELSSSEVRNEGTILTYYEESTVGDHEGIHGYSVGQDHIGVKGHIVDSDLTVIKVHPKGPVLVDRSERLFFTHIHCNNMTLASKIDVTVPFSAYVKYSSAMEAVKCTVFMFSNNSFLIALDEKQKGIIGRGMAVAVYSQGKMGGKLLMSAEARISGHFDNGEFLQYHKTREVKEQEEANPPLAPLSDFNF